MTREEAKKEFEKHLAYCEEKRQRAVDDFISASDSKAAESELRAINYFDGCIATIKMAIYTIS